MDVVERLTLETAQADTMLAREHRHRYEFAATLVGGLRVLDLCCGSGYGTQILAATARDVVGVDNDAATVELATRTVARDTPSTSFMAADAVAFLRSDICARFDVLVCFEGLEHLSELERALELMAEHAAQGLKIIASVPNGKLFEEDNPHHVTEFGYDEAVRAFARFPGAVMVPQFLAEGSLIAPPDATETEVSVTLGDRDEPEYANHFLWLIGFDPAAVAAAHHGRMRVTAAPVFNRWSEDLKHAAWALRRENARLGRARLGKGGAAAASALARIDRTAAELTELQARLSASEARVAELEGQLGRAHIAGTGATPEPVTVTPVTTPRPRAITAHTATVKSAPPGENPNSWDERRRRAAETIIPWVEQTVALAGKTVLEYGCGHAAVSCSFAERAGRHIGLDIDAEAVEVGRALVRERGLENLELEAHPVESILDAARAHAGAVDVFLMYAVLEHLTLDERLAVLRVAREVVRPDGAIIVCETPNRLSWLDHHTARIPFYHLLPDELALLYRDRSERTEFVAAIDAAAAEGPAAGLEGVVRWGRGVSFHEFELVFGNLAEHVIASSYDPLLLPERAVEMDEVLLARFLDLWRPDLAPAWSRRWLDVILSPEPVSVRPPFIRPWRAQTVSSRAVGYTDWDALHLPGPDAVLWIELPVATDRLLIGMLAEPGDIELTVRTEAMPAPIAYRTWATSGASSYADLRLPEPAQRIGVSTSRRCDLVFVGYEE